METVSIILGTGLFILLVVFLLSAFAYIILKPSAAARTPAGDETEARRRFRRWVLFFWIWNGPRDSSW